jgi:hypothetical protein
MPTGFPQITTEQVKEFVDGLGDSLGVDVADPILNPGMIIDNPKAVYDELVSNAYATDKFKNVLNFKAIVLWKLKTQSEFSLFSALRSLLPFLNSQGSDSSTFFVCYIPELHATMTNPLYFAGDQQEYIKRILRFPSFQISSVADKTNKSLLEECQEGSVVNVRFTDSNRRLGYVTELVTEGNWSEALKHSGDSDSSQVFASGDAVVSEDAVAFYNKLRSSGAFSGYSDTMLMGLAANAKQESNFTSNAAGDARSPGNKDHPRTITTVDGVRGVEADYCSFGYFQLNICPDNAEGTRFIEFFGLDRNNKQEVLDAITNEEKQFQFMANRLAQIGSISQYIGDEVAEGYSEEETAAFYGRLIARDFENCSACADGQSENRERQELAAALYRELRQENEANS